MRWAVKVAHMGQKRNAYGLLVGRSEVKTNLEDLGMEGRNLKN
jgi:hypothetical protein